MRVAVDSVREDEAVRVALSLGSVAETEGVPSLRDTVAVCCLVSTLPEPVAVAVGVAVTLRVVGMVALRDALGVGAGSMMTMSANALVKTR